MPKLLAPFLWVAGVLLLAASLLVPFFRDGFLLKNQQATAEKIVEQIAQAEEQHFHAREKYLFFVKGEVPDYLKKVLGEKSPVTDAFVFDAYLEGGESLVIRATTSEEKLKSASLPLMIFVYKKHMRSHQVNKEWVTKP